jgi:hypothetical protein
MIKNSVSIGSDGKDRWVRQIFLSGYRSLIMTPVPAVGIPKGHLLAQCALKLTRLPCVIGIIKKAQLWRDL